MSDSEANAKITSRRGRNEEFLTILVQPNGKSRGELNLVDAEARIIRSSCLFLRRDTTGHPRVGSATLTGVIVSVAEQWQADFIVCAVVMLAGKS